jgi:hypothetical protein
VLRAPVTSTCARKPKYPARGGPTHLCKFASSRQARRSHRPSSLTSACRSVGPARCCRRASSGTGRRRVRRRNRAFAGSLDPARKSGPRHDKGVPGARPLPTILTLVLSFFSVPADRSQAAACLRQRLGRLLAVWEAYRLAVGTPGRHAAPVRPLSAWPAGSSCTLAGIVPVSAHWPCSEHQTPQDRWLAG